MRHTGGVFVPWGVWKHALGWVVDENGCHIWTGSRDGAGYARANVNRRNQLVQRVRYEREVGPVPDGMVLDHYVCDNGPGGCCNPLHCRPVTNRENILRGNGASAAQAAKVACHQGHPFDAMNTSVDPKSGARRCRTCHTEWRRKCREILNARRRTPEAKARRNAKLAQRWTVRRGEGAA